MARKKKDRALLEAAQRVAASQEQDNQANAEAVSLAELVTVAVVVPPPIPAPPPAAPTASLRRPRRPRR